eukprot:gb/GECG01008966.1/.p1 GENE.gb/GECG01008966.1/~~gb/GECG01008966.1/.p1  ORF type:complete len:351 (+),score=57.21 gb/GECG01008966.1/:1-1053(+)
MSLSAEEQQADTLLCLTDAGKGGGGGLRSTSASVLSKFMTLMKGNNTPMEYRQRIVDVLHASSYMTLKALTEKYPMDISTVLKKWLKEAHAQAVQTQTQDKTAFDEGYQLTLSLLKLLRKFPFSFDILRTSRIGSVVGKMSSQVGTGKANQLNSKEIVSLADALVEKWKRVGREAQQKSASFGSSGTTSAPSSASPTPQGKSQPPSATSSPSATAHGNRESGGAQQKNQRTGKRSAQERTKNTASSPPAVTTETKRRRTSGDTSEEEQRVKKNKRQLFSLDSSDSSINQQRSSKFQLLIPDFRAYCEGGARELRAEAEIAMRLDVSGMHFLEIYILCFSILLSSKRRKIV